MMQTDSDPQNPFKLEMPFEEALARYAKVNTKETTEAEEETVSTATPFVKWVGGKRSLINELISNLPSEFNDFYEPFVGGGALFFALNEGLPVAYLSDTNLDLVLTYKVIQKEPQKLIDQLKIHNNNHSEEYYYKIRSQHELQDPIKIAARLLYLNKTCYNGLYRVNKSGHFNVPIGRYTNPNIVQETNILACHEALKSAIVEYKQFDQITPKKDDFVYFDPPYHPTDEASFTTYTKSNFTETDQVRLRDFALELHKRGVKVMLSNSNTKFINDLYKDKAFKIKIVNAPRFVNCKSNKRNAVEEVLIVSY
jgi:DNA adenine methylase